MGTSANTLHREPWNKGKIVGQKAPFKPTPKNFPMASIKRIEGKSEQRREAMERDR